MTHEIIAQSQDAKKCVFTCTCGRKFSGKTETDAEDKFDAHR